MERMHTGTVQTSYINPLSYWVIDSPILYYKPKAFSLNIFSTHWSYEVIFSCISKVLVTRSCPALCDPMNCKILMICLLFISQASSSKKIPFCSFVSLMWHSLFHNILFIMFIIYAAHHIKIANLLIYFLLSTLNSLLKVFFFLSLPVQHLVEP